MNTATTYEQLYSNMVKKFTVEKNNTDYKLGDYMLMKANAKKTADTTSNLPATVSRRSDRGNALVSFVAYVNDKLTVKEPPVRDKTIRSFPFRTVATAFCSAIVICALALSYGMLGINSAAGSDNTVKSEYVESEVEEQKTALDNTVYGE